MKTIEINKLMKRCYFITLDPVHIGTGDYRLGRVDNTIVREPGSNLPKIPGTSLCGAARSYAALHYGEPEAAGRHQKMKSEAKSKSLIAKVFGTATDTGGGMAGRVSISDARILFFPVYSLNGPVWVSTYELLKENGFIGISEEFDDGEALVSWQINRQSTVNLGWLLLKVKANCRIEPPDDFPAKDVWTTIKDRIVIVKDTIYSQIVNSNLEVRTSVAIDPETGAAEEGALFTYEAIPRATWLWTELIEHNYVHDSQEIEDKNFALSVVETGLKMIEYFGVGGMVTRGFGRMRLFSGKEDNQ